jgi:hypothetical protein
VKGPADAPAIETMTTNDDDDGTITITLRVDAATAIRAGSGRIGAQVLHVGRAALASLTDDQRDALALHVGGSPSGRSDVAGWGDPLTLHADPIGKSDLPTLALLLDTRRAVMAAQDAADLAMVREKMAATGPEKFSGVARDVPVRLLEWASHYGMTEPRLAQACVAAGLTAQGYGTADQLGIADEVDALNAARAVEDAALARWLDSLRELPIAALADAPVPPECFDAWIRKLGARGLPVPTWQIAAAVCRRSEWDRHEAAVREAGEAAEREAVAAVLDIAGPPELAALQRAGKARPADVSRALRSWVRALTVAPALPQDWRGDSDGGEDPDGIPVEAARAAAAWSAHVAALAWPAGVSATVGASWAWRPADEDAGEHGDRDGEVATATVAIVVTLPDGDEIAVHTTVEARPPVASASDAKRAAVQRRIADAVRAAPPSRVASFVAEILRDGPDDHEAIRFAATLDPMIADALRQVAQCHALA